MERWQLSSVSSGQALYEACQSLSRANIPFRFIVAGDDWVADRMLDADLSAYRAVVRFEPSHLNERQESRLREYGGKLLTYRGADDLLSQLDADINIAGADNISVLLRHKPDDAGAPLVCHLLNANYDADADGYETARDLVLRIDRRLLGRTFTRAWLFAPSREPREIACRADAQMTTITVPELDMWAIVQLA